MKAQSEQWRVFIAIELPSNVRKSLSDHTAELTKLHRTLEDECAKAEFAREGRPFHPHLTIARLRKPQGSRQLAKLHEEMGFTDQQVSVSEVVLFRSELLSEGSRHTAISRHRFG